MIARNAAEVLEALTRLHHAFHQMAGYARCRRPAPPHVELLAIEEGADDAFQEAYGFLDAAATAETGDRR